MVMFKKKKNLLDFHVKRGALVAVGETLENDCQRRSDWKLKAVGAEPGLLGAEPPPAPLRSGDPELPVPKSHLAGPAVAMQLLVAPDHA